MKTRVPFILSLLLVMAILAPSVLTLVERGKNTSIAIDFNEEEQKEEKKELSEQDFFLKADFDPPVIISTELIAMAKYYVESDYTTALVIFLPPPETGT